MIHQLKLIWKINLSAHTMHNIQLMKDITTTTTTTTTRPHTLEVNCKVIFVLLSRNEQSRYRKYVLYLSLFHYCAISFVNFGGGSCGDGHK